MKLTAAETAQLNALCKKFRIDVLTVLHEKSRPVIRADRCPSAKF